MKKLIAIAAVIGVLLGVLAGYLWWGTRAQPQLAEVRGQLFTVQSELKAAEDKIKSLEADLRLERDRRQKLEEIVTQGRK